MHSSSLVPANDPTLLFTNAGMNQFKDVFLGAETRGYTRAASSQKCVRAGGKHNDLENVGFTRRHHTFFEMLGNFSFGDYIQARRDRFCVGVIDEREWFGIDPARVRNGLRRFGGEGAGGSGSYVPRDAEAEQLWIETGVPAERIFAMGAKDNFWADGRHRSMRPVLGNLLRPRPRCLGVSRCVRRAGGPAISGRRAAVCRDLEPGLHAVRPGGRWNANNAAEALDRYRHGAGADCVCVAGVCVELSDGPVYAVDRSGCGVNGIERADAEERALSDAKGAASLRIIADHARAATFLISDGVLPANEGRGYVLRKIMRRAIRHGRLLGQEQPFLFEMAAAVRDEMGVAYPELRESAERVMKVVLAEERQFARVLEGGVKKLEECFAVLRRKKDVCRWRKIG